MRVALVANHAGEVRMSMRRFAALMASELERLGVDVTVLAPESSALSRQLGARARSVADKLAFSARLRRERRFDVIHVIDQGDAGHALLVHGGRSVVTCHDVSVLVDPTFRGTPWTRGWVYRSLLLARMQAGLGRAGAVVCDSDYTLGDVERVLGTNAAQLRARVHLPLRFAPGGAAPLPDAVARLELPYVLHVGSNGFRKNRRTVLEVVARTSRPLALVFAGEPADATLVAFARELGIAERLVNVPAPSDATLAALYAKAHCLLFPSTFEGFGWPVVEAQASGCPVVASDVTSVPEIGGKGALYAAPHDVPRLSAHLTALFDGEERNRLVALGHDNARYFAGIELGREYVAIYERLMAAHPLVQ